MKISTGVNENTRSFRRLRGRSRLVGGRHRIGIEINAVTLGGHPKCTTCGQLKMYQGSVGS